jgi:hypothetical protein
MKLKSFERLDNYFFYFTFENGEMGEVSLEELVSSHVGLDELNTAFINKEWGCLEFKNGAVDIEPKTLYKFFLKNRIIDKQMAS